MPDVSIAGEEWAAGVVDRRITMQRGAIADLLALAWSGTGTQRTFHALYAVHGEWRSAIIVQTRGMYGFRVGVVRDVSRGGAEQLNSMIVSTQEAVIWLGLDQVDEPPVWGYAL